MFLFREYENGKRLAKVELKKPRFNKQGIAYKKIIKVQSVYFAKCEITSFKGPNNQMIDSR